MTTQYIYVLKLESEKYYVGKTDDVLRRVGEHSSKASVSAEWTKHYSVVKLIYCMEEKTMFDEDNKTKEYMMKYGFQNVRGGSYSKFELEEDQLSLLKKELAGAMGLCFNCGRAGHYIGECSREQAVSRKEPTTVSGETQMLRELCKRCGRNTHTSDTCGARTTIDGKPICGRCGRLTHETSKCKSKTRIDGSRLE